MITNTTNLIAQSTSGTGGHELGGFVTGLGVFQTSQPADAPATFNNLASMIFGFLTIVAGLAFVLYFVLGAVNWITSSGEKNKVDSAKNQMTSAAIGLIIVIAAYAIIGIVGTVLGIDLLDPVKSLNLIGP